MRISRDKTEVMTTSREPIPCDIQLDWESLHKQAEQVKYLEIMFVRDDGCKDDVKTRCLKASHVFFQTFTYIRVPRNQHDHQYTDHKKQYLPNSTLPE